MSDCKHVAFQLIDSKVFDNDGTEIGCTGGGLIKCADCDKTVFGIQEENTQLKSDLQALRKRLKDLSKNWGMCIVCECELYLMDGSRDNNPGHYDNCWLKAELDKLEATK